MTGRPADPVGGRRPRAARRDYPDGQTDHFLVAAERSVLHALETDLERRFGTDCRILSTQHPDRALADLTALAKRQEPVALLIADRGLRETTGVAFLERAHALHPSAKRILLVERDYTPANPIVPRRSPPPGSAG